MEEKKGKEIEWMLRMDSNLHKAFLTAAQENDRSPSELVREFMENYIKTHKRNEPPAE